MEHHTIKMDIYHVEECADTNECGLIMNLQPTNTAIEMNCSTGVT